ncbi:alpha/beta-hydrolase [Schizophyllum commune H4-8]|nr:alpha/beta-hydrolase [Schizophyllum commune H4-8]KAI5890818.1 alpha/beta-hydrolase [Schizophyllum commune H4-8]
MLILLLSNLLLTLTAVSATRPTVHLGYATYEGAYDSASDSTSFLGVRYAAPPVGELRWRPPQPPVPQLGVQQATVPPLACVQGSVGLAAAAPIFMRGEKTAENATLLDVYTPGKFRAHSSKRKPVLVYIHGGGYVQGSGTGLSGPDANDARFFLQRAKGGLIMVVVQYRLGMYGFLAGADARDAGAANAGLLDQQFALQWVQKHIHKFGGDPSDVTIWGLSAGAGSVYQHIVANDGQTSPALFDTAIVSSNYLPPQYDVEDPISEARWSSCAPETDALDCLRDADASVLRRVNADMAVSAFYGTFLFVPVVDHCFIQQAPSQALEEGRVNGNHLLAVNNADEGSLFVDTSDPDAFNTTSWLKNAWPKLTDSNIARALTQYHDLAPVDQATTIMGDIIFLCPSYPLMRAFEKPYKAEFAIDNAWHGRDLPYYFPDTVYLFGKAYNNTDFDTAFASAFSNFALSKDPNVKVGEDLTPEWAHWSDECTVEMIFNKTENDVPDVRASRTDERVLERCSFWQSIGPSVGQ